MPVVGGVSGSSPAVTGAPAPQSTARRAKAQVRVVLSLCLIGWRPAWASGTPATRLGTNARLCQKQG